MTCSRLPILEVELRFKSRQSDSRARPLQPATRLPFYREYGSADAESSRPAGSALPWGDSLKGSPPVNLSRAPPQVLFEVIKVAEDGTCRWHMTLAQSHTGSRASREFPFRQCGGLCYLKPSCYETPGNAV